MNEVEDIIISTIGSLPDVTQYRLRDFKAIGTIEAVIGAQ